MKGNSIKINVWHLINNSNPERGGAQKILAQLTNQDEKIISIQPSRHAIINTLPDSLTTLISIAIKIITNKPDIIYIHNRCFLPLSWLLKAIGKKSVFYAHANYRKHLWLYKVFPCDHYIAVSESVRNSLLEQGVEEKTVTTITNPYIGETYIGTHPTFNNKVFKAGFVGSLNNWKGIIELIKAIYDISSNLKGSISFKIVGDGPLMGHIKKLKETAPKNVEIIICGFQKTPFEFLKDSHTLLIPSLEEGFGLVAIEGIYQGKILLYNTIPALHEICKDDPLSFSFDIHRASSLLSAINSAINSINLLGDMELSKNRSESITNKYNLEKFTQKHQLLRSIILNQHH
ncbi:glycosyltransferase family 4 protein [Pseudomonas nitroreducens]|uniref:Glycosyltransferase family 4 protein n=1 Tax=Pseudomonas nitroreducens TaxID=46680 RepID=A0ABS0KHI9_PSENT|nr:glycosyltransferase family 4 protein [Pseudomonas nitroreducens]MBG6287498.1 glycosyltransferase family 4 protein [Pseudomonas nitroreducens]NMZ61360.1 glycosyltransferase family 4 protein [Pseudomonas nitroreducens]SNT48672.1 Glycosyltransferase involved in cell wall bisynthesis [Pseudomonas nitroreducens]